MGINRFLIKKLVVSMLVHFKPVFYRIRGWRVILYLIVPIEIEKAINNFLSSIN